MIVHDHEQGSQGWLHSRAGVTTASIAKDARARYKSGPKKGQFTDTAKDLAFKLAMERLAGIPLFPVPVTWAMNRGKELEPDARITHEQKIGQLIEEAGFVTTDCGRYGASADGLINHDGGAEYKCLVAPARIRAVMMENDLSDFMDQVQMCMWITDRKWWHFCLYVPDLKPIGQELTIRHVDRDNKYIEELKSDLEDFDALINEFTTKLASAAA